MLLTETNVRWEGRLSFYYSGLEQVKYGQRLPVNGVAVELFLWVTLGSSLLHRSSAYDSLHGSQRAMLALRAPDAIPVYCS